jgi:hypothetical protein
VYELKSVWRHSTLIVPSPIARRQSIAASIQRLPVSVVKSVSTARHRQRVDVSGETIRSSVSLRLAVNFFLQVMRMKYIQMLVFKSIFDLLWTGRDSSVSAVAFFFLGGGGGAVG